MTAHSTLEELALYLRPAGGGVHMVSTGRAQQWALQQAVYQVTSEEALQRKFRESLEAIAQAKVVLLACPSDVGAGILRGSNMAPMAIRAQLLKENPTWPDEARERGVVDIGDIFVVPQLLHDSMLSAAQLSATRRALYSSDSEALPVSPLSVAERVYELIFKLNPKVKFLLLGGDHSNAWPLASFLAKTRTKPISIVQPDAHTDLLEERLGIQYCFATWSFHANNLLGRNERLVQVGTRASRQTQAHWEGTLGVKQFWAKDVLGNPDAALENIVSHVKKLGVESVYFSNDIDGTDEAFADATGTPEPEGLHPDFVVELIRRLGREVGLCAADVMEVAPPIQRTPRGAEQTVALAVRYLRESLAALLY